MWTRISWIGWRIFQSLSLVWASSPQDRKCVTVLYFHYRQLDLFLYAYLLRLLLLLLGNWNPRLIRDRGRSCRFDEAHLTSRVENHSNPRCRSWYCGSALHWSGHNVVRLRWFPCRIPSVGAQIVGEARYLSEVKSSCNFFLWRTTTADCPSVCLCVEAISRQCGYL